MSLHSMRYLRFVRRWIRVGDPADRLEARLYVGTDISTAVIRDRAWGKVLYCEPGRTALLSALPDAVNEREFMSFLRRAPAVEGRKGAPVPFNDPTFMKKWPAVFEYITAASWPDGKPRQPSSLSLFCEDGMIKCCLVEKDENLVLFAAGRTLETLLNALEGLLTAADTPWRAGRLQSGQRGSGRGKGA